MATKSSTKKGAKKTAQKHDLLYIMSPTCGWCKKADPVVDELIKDGYKITKLDVTIPEEGKRANEVKQKFNAQCGTPLFLDGETGNMKCGFAEKDIIEKWAKGEEIPAPPQPTILQQVQDKTRTILGTASNPISALRDLEIFQSTRD